MTTFEELTELYFKIKLGKASAEDKTQFNLLIEKSCIKTDMLMQMLERKYKEKPLN